MKELRRSRPLEVKKVEQPRSLGERKRERRQVESAERGRRPQAAPVEEEKLKEAPAERGWKKVAPPDNVQREGSRGGTEREGRKDRR